MELTKIKNEVLRKIGRNVLLYQQVEHILKYLVSNGRISGNVDTLKSSLEKRKSSVAKRTMGMVAGDFFAEILGEYDSLETNPENPSKAQLSINFRIETEEKHFELRQDKIAALVADRNELIHHLMPKLNTDSVETWIETGRHLDLQREKIIPELEYLQKIAQQFSSMRKELGEYLMSPEGRRQFLNVTD